MSAGRRIAVGESFCLYNVDSMGEICFILQVYLQQGLNVVQYPRKVRAAPGKENVMRFVRFILIPNEQITTMSEIIISDCDFVRSYGAKNRDC